MKILKRLANPKIGFGVAVVLGTRDLGIRRTNELRLLTNIMPSLSLYSVILIELSLAWEAQ